LEKKSVETEKLERRDFTKRFLATAFSVSFLETLFTGCSDQKHHNLVKARNEKLQISETNKIIEKPAAEILNHWAIELNEICNDLRTDKISQRIWQGQIDKLFARIELKELLNFIDFEKLIEGFEYPDLGVNTKVVNFPEMDGLPPELFFIKKIFGVKEGRSIIPHGQSNMVSAHLVLEGEFSLKHFDKIREEKKHLVIKPTIDKVISKGDYSNISDEKDNVHWFTARSKTAFTFDVIMTGLNRKQYDIQNIDIREGEKISDGLIRAEKIDVRTALKKYGKDHHQNYQSTL
jgi:hypothetical protein